MRVPWQDNIAIFVIKMILKIILFLFTFVTWVCENIIWQIL